MAGRTPPFPNVTVLLGDPQLADSTKHEGAFHEEDMASRRVMEQALAEVADRHGYRFAFHDDHGTMLDVLREQPPDFVLNLCDTGFRNSPLRELNLPAYLELYDIPYSGATPACMALGWDKAVVRAVAEGIGVPVPAEAYLAPGEDPEAKLRDRYPALIKPSCADGSVGITVDSVVHDRDAALARIAALRAELPGRALLVQEFLNGTEYGVGVVGNPETGLTALPPMEVDYTPLGDDKPHILGFESKAIPDSPYYTDIRYREARLDAEARAALEADALTLYERFGFRDYGRFDFRADATGTIKLLEINPNPAWAKDAKLAYMAAFAGIDYPELLRMILETAQSRAARETG